MRSQQEGGDGDGEAGGGGSGGSVGGKGGGNVLRALQYLRRLCSHPAMVLDWKVCVWGILGVWGAGAGTAAGKESRAPLQLA